MTILGIKWDDNGWKYTLHYRGVLKGTKATKKCLIRSSECVVSAVCFILRLQGHSEVISNIESVTLSSPTINNAH